MARALVLGTAALFAAAILGLASRDASSDSAGAGNAFLRVFVEDRAGRDGRGVFTLSTGSGDAREILFGEDGPGDAATSYITLRSYTTGTDYVQTARGAASGNLVRALDAMGSVEASDSGYRTTYDLGAGKQPDALTLVSDVRVEGSMIEDTKARLSATVMNTGGYAVDIGVRYLLDVAPYGDDGPALSFPGSGVFDVQERESNAGGSVKFGGQVADAGPPVIVSRGGEMRGDRAVYAYWPEAFEFAWEYTVRNRDIATNEGLNDAALLYYFGARGETALHLEPGGAVTVSLELRFDASTPGVTPVPTPTPPSTPGPPTPTPAATPQRTPAELPRTGRR